MSIKLKQISKLRTRHSVSRSKYPIPSPNHLRITSKKWVIKETVAKL